MKINRVVALTVAGVLLVTLLGTTDTLRLSAQEAGSPTASPTVPPTATPLPTPTAYPLQKMTFNLLATADIQLQTDAPSYVRAATISVAPGMTSLPFRNEGPVVLAVT